MRKLLTTCSAVFLGFFALNACADTEQIDSTSYQVVLEEPTPFTTPQGNTVLLGLRQHASVVAADGGVISQYCTGMGMPAEDGGLANGAGFCTAIQPNGDVLWVSYKINGGGAANWNVIGGTGEYEGATGGGTSQIVAQGGDGRSWTTKITGTITTP